MLKRGILNSSVLSLLARVRHTNTLVISGTALVGIDLSDDHPVNFTYNTTLQGNDGELADPTTSPVADLLVGGKVQCSSCHDPHKTTYTPFLVADNGDSALCRTCHQK